MPLASKRWIVIRRDRRTGLEFYDWDTLSPSAVDASKRARREDRLTGCGRAYPIVRIVEGEFVEKGTPK